MSSYDDDAFDDLPVTRRDIGALSQALEARGYDVEMIGAGEDRTGRSDILAAIRRALYMVPPNETLLIYFSGHGIHYKGQSYLVPSDCPSPDEDPSHLGDYLIPVTSAQLSDSCAARRLLTFVDACRDGVHVRSKATSEYLDLWSSEEQEQALRQHEARIYGCSPGERCRYEPAPDGLSCFTRALVDALGAATLPAGIRAFAERVQTQLDVVTTRAGVAQQHIRLEAAEGVADDDGAWFPTRPGGGRGSIARLLDEALGGRDNSDAQELRAAFDDVLAYDSLDSDERWGGADYYERVAFHVRRLCNDPSSGSILSPAEAYALTVAIRTRPLFVARASRPLMEALADPGAPADPRLPAARAAYPALGRKLARFEVGDRGLGSQVASWIAERWVIADPAVFDDETVRDIVLGWVRTLEPNNLRQRELTDIVVAMARAIATTAADLSSIETSLPSTYALGSDWGLDEFRPRLLSQLLAVAGGLAIDPRRLGEVVPAHIGLRDHLDAQDVHHAVGAARWIATRVGWDLDLECPHPAIDKGLRDWTMKFNELLEYLGAEGQPSRQAPGMRYRASTTRLRPSQEHGNAAYQLPHVSFRLSTEETRELLMGTELYGDPSIAFRELYQNALDACRYRAARLRYLESKGVVTGSSWRGSIAFRVGSTEAGPYVECEDNGIGMGTREVERAFARAGVRFQDLPEFAEEYHEWQKELPDLIWAPTSRFGIGVFSYFMVADEIQVETSRVSHAGQPQAGLRVDIAGSGSLFRLRQLEGPTPVEGGTRVRLYLSGEAARDPAMCERTLRALLRLTEFETTYSDDRTERRWAPGSLYRDGAPVPSQQGTHRRVWWTHGPTELVTDGIVPHDDVEPSDGLFRPSAAARPGRDALPGSGCSVNLGGELPAELSVDRARIRDWPRARCRAAVLASVSALPAWDSLTFEWLWGLGNDLELLLAVEQVLAVAEVRLPCERLAVKDVEFRAIGLVPTDREIVAGRLGARASVQSWIVGQRLRLWAEADAEMGAWYDLARVCIPASLRGYPPPSAIVGHLHASGVDDRPRANTDFRRGLVSANRDTVLAAAELSGSTLGEVVQELRRHSMLAGDRPQIFRGRLGDARPDAEIWQVLKILPPYRFERLLMPWNQDRTAEPHVVTDLGSLNLSEVDFIRMLDGDEFTPVGLEGVLAKFEASVAWDAERPPWASLDRPLTEVEMALLSPEHEVTRGSSHSDAVMLIGRIASEWPRLSGPVAEIVEAFRTITGDEMLAGILAESEGLDDLRLRCSAIAFGCGLRPELPFHAPPLPAIGEHAESAVKAQWDALRRDHPELNDLMKRRGEDAPTDASPEAAPELVRYCLSIDADGKAPFRALQSVTPRHVIKAAAKLQRDTAEFVAALQSYAASLELTDELSWAVPAGTPPEWVRAWINIQRLGIKRLPGLVKLAFDGRVALGEIFDAARAFIGPESVEDLVAALPPAALTRVPEPSDDRVLTDLLLDGEDGNVTLLAVAGASFVEQRTLRSALEIASAYVHVADIPEERPDGAGEFIVNAAQLVALAQDLDGQYIYAGPQITLLHLVRVAARMGGDVGGARRLLVPFEVFGVALPDVPDDLAGTAPVWSEIRVLSDYVDVIDAQEATEREDAERAVAKSTASSIREVRDVLDRYRDLDLDAGIPRGWGPHLPTASRG